MAELWKAWKAKNRLPTLPTLLGNLAQTARFPHSHSSGDGFQLGQRKANRKKKLWAVEKWKSKTRIPTFPQPRQPAAQGKNVKKKREPKRRLHKSLDTAQGQLSLGVE